MTRSDRCLCAMVPKAAQSVSVETASALGNERTRLHDERLKGSLAMEVKAIKQKVLSERHVLKEDATRWRRM